MDAEPSKGISVSIIQSNDDGRRCVALNLYDYDQMLVLNAEAARNMAFLLVRCADLIEPPFDETSKESVAIFGPYEAYDEATRTNDAYDNDEDDEDDEDDEEDDDEDVVSY